MKKVCADRQRTESVYTDTRKRERREKRGREERERLTFTAAKHHSQSIGKTWSSQIKKKTQKERKDKKEHQEENHEKLFLFRCDHVHAKLFHGRERERPQNKKNKQKYETYE